MEILVENAIKMETSIFAAMYAQNEIIWQILLLLLLIF